MHRHHPHDVTNNDRNFDADYHPDNVGTYTGTDTESEQKPDARTDTRPEQEPNARANIGSLQGTQCWPDFVAIRWALHRADAVPYRVSDAADFGANSGPNAVAELGADIVAVDWAHNEPKLVTNHVAHTAHARPDCWPDPWPEPVAH